MGVAAETLCMLIHSSRFFCLACFSTVSRHWFVIYYGFTPNLKGVVFGKFLFPKEEAPA